MQNCRFQVPDGNCHLCLSKSGCEAWTQMVRTHTCVAMKLRHLSVAIQTRLCHYKCAALHQLFVLPGFPTLLRAHKRLGWTNRAVSRCNDSHNSVMYSRATRTTTTYSSFQVSKKNLGSHICTNSGYQVLLSIFSWVPGNEANTYTYPITSPTHGTQGTGRTAVNQLRHQ